MESLKSRDIPNLQKNMKKNNDEIQRLRDQVTNVRTFSQCCQVRGEWGRSWRTLCK